MLDLIFNNTLEYLEQFTKKERKVYGQFFTSKETALFMASMFKILDNKKTLNILDAGAGSGILSAALIQTLQRNTKIENINLVCYENDKNILDLLKNNLNQIKANCIINFNYQIINDNYITSQSHITTTENSNTDDGFDLIISNPPYIKLTKNAPEALAMPYVCYGAPNLYFLFAAMGINNLKDQGEMVFIIPRSWTSGAYFKKFREFLFDKSIIDRIHLFIDRSKVFEVEDVLQETMIIKIKKCYSKSSNDDNKILITTSKNNNDFSSITKFTALSSEIISNINHYVYLITNKEDLNLLSRLNNWKYTLLDLGLKMKTGLTVDFRNKDLLKHEKSDDVVPLFYAHHIQDGEIIFPLKENNEYISKSQSGLLQSNDNYLFVKRFTSKEEKRRLQCAIYLKNQFPSYDYISTQNKINFITSKHGLSEELLHGLYVLFNSSYYDRYYRILNGSTQVNATEINSMPIPSRDIIIAMGNKLLLHQDKTSMVCDLIIKEYL